MEKSLDLGFVFRNHETKHKSKPTQFMSMNGGVQKRLESTLKYRKSCRLTEFDNVRDLSASDSPKKPINEAELKIEHRKQQLEKWKQEKEKTKKQQAMNKKKPFLVGVVHAPLKFMPPPSTKPMPSSSGRITRSQSARVQNAKQKETKANSSFAPKSSYIFKPPQIKNATTLPAFPSTKTRQKPSSKVAVTFEPIVFKKVNTAKEPEKLTCRNNTNKGNERKVKAKPSPKKLKTTVKLAESSSQSSTDTSMQEKPVRRVTRKSSTQNFLIETVNEPLVLKTRSTRKSITSSESQESVILPTRKTPRKSLADELKKTPRKSKSTPKNKQIPKSESSSEEKLRSPKVEDVQKTPEQIVDEAIKISQSSPLVTMSRGKDNARREIKQKLREGLLDEDASDHDSVEYFQRQMDSEIARMTLLADAWDKVYTTALPEFVQELILTAVGQARLLMSQKMRQFAGLVARCAARDASAGLVTPADLAGFWDMLFIQIDNIDVRFKQLDALRAGGWSEEPPPLEPQRRASRPPRRAKPAGNSRIREMIAAARKAKKDQVTPKQSANLPGESENKTFEAGFFTVRSPVRSPLATPRREPSLLQCVLSSEARKASASKISQGSPAPFAMLRASLKGKHLDVALGVEGVEGVAPLEQTPKHLSQINLDATPARSILKSVQKAKKSAKKSIKTVLFDQSDEEASPDVTKDFFFLLEVTPTKEKEAMDSGVASMDIETDNKENKKRRSKLVRQEALEHSPMMTRLRRKSLQTPVLDTEVLQEVEQEENKTPKRTSRRNKSVDKRSDQMEDLIDLSSPKEQTRRTRRGRRTEI